MLETQKVDNDKIRKALFVNLWNKGLLYFPFTSIICNRYALLRTGSECVILFVLKW